MGLARLVYAVAASAAFCLEGLSATSAWAASQPRANVEGQVEGGLKGAIVQAIGETDRPIANRFEARRRARAAAEDAIAVLRSEGYYAYAVEPDVGEGDAPAAIVRVTPGPLFHLQSPAIAWIGSEPDAQTAQAASGALALRPGGPGRAADIVGAEGRAVAAVQKRGYADVRAEPREVVVDHADNSVNPTFRIAAGPLVRLDGIDLTTDGRTNPAWIQGLAPWKHGDVYNPERVAELERRLLDTSVFDSVTVGLAPSDKNTPEGFRPVVVSLAERKRRTIEAGGSYSTTEGIGVDLRWTRYNMLRRADTVSPYGRLSEKDSRAGVDIKLPHWRRPDLTLTIAPAVYRVRTDAYDETGFGVSADVQKRLGKTSYFTVGASVDASRTDELALDARSVRGRRIVTLGTLADLALDRSNDPLDPRRGYRVSGRAEPTMLLGETNVPYLKLQTQGSAYLPLGRAARTVLAGRVRVGSILGGTLSQIPASKRFYAGGGGSVRGFSYQGVGPRLADGTPQGGLSLLESSAEVRRDLFGKWGVAAFVDAGAVGSRAEWPGFKDLSVGAGVGVRYNPGFGPIRIDIATPLVKKRDEAKFALYLSIGQSF